MNFNAEDISLIAQGPPASFSKEGLLLIRVDKTNKKNKGYSERWFSLKGNLLFCMKGNGRATGIQGVVVMERCTIELDAEETGDLYSFVIGQAGSADRIYLASRTEAEREDWMSNLHTASYECMKMQLENLRENIMRRTGRDPLLSPASTKSVRFACSQLQCLNSRALNTCVDVLTQVPPSSTWKFIGQTETVESSANPFYLKTIGLGDYNTPPRTRVRVMVYDVQELVTGTRTQIGQATFLLEDLLADKKLTLIILSPDGNQTGVVVVMAWFTDLSTTSAQEDLNDTKSRLSMSAQRIADKCDCATFRTRKKDQLKPLYANGVSKIFRFPTVNQHQLSVCEIMAESKLTVAFPLSYLRFLLQQNNQWKDEIHKLSSLPYLKEDKSHSLVYNKASLYSDYLSRQINDLETKYSMQTFKKSIAKSDEGLAAIPINLHIHRMAVYNESTQSSSVYDVITVGGFAAHNKGFKSGGLLRSFKPYTFRGNIPQQTNLRNLVACSKRLVSLQQAVVVTLDEIYRACMSKDRDSLKLSSDKLGSQVNEIAEFSDEDASLAESIQRLSASQTAHALHNESARSSIPSSCDTLQQQWKNNVYTFKAAGLQLVQCVTACLEQLDPVMWLEHISMTKMKCEAFLDKLYSTASDAVTLSSVKESLTDPFCYDLELVSRFTLVSSQALTAAATGILTKVRYQIMNTQLLEQISQIGCLLHFEGLLSCYKAELGMLEDFIIGVEYLSLVEFRFTESSSSQDYLSHPPHLTGNRISVCVNLPLPRALFELLPDTLQHGQTFKAVPLLFNIGINELATLAERVGCTEVQEQCNKFSYSLLNEYYHHYQSAFGSIGSDANSPYSISELLVKLEQNVNDVKKKKNVEVLQLAAEICRKLGAVQFVSCKSAKDRSSMSVTLEACRILQQEHELPPHVFTQALNCLRSDGVRRTNVFKNTGSSSYAFSSFQLMNLPKLYRPPTGTYGKGET